MRLRCWRTRCRGDAQEQLPDPAAAVLARQRARDSPTARSGSVTSTAGYRRNWPTGGSCGSAHSVRRVLHIPAGNGGLVSAVTILRSVITRCDTIIKAPSNDPLTAVAIARTLADVAPDHPITRHLAVGYWKGGDVAVEEPLYRPEHIEKIVAWGGFASVKHVTRYIQPGLEMIALDPKRSATIIGHQAFSDDETMREVARCAAVDIGVANQEGCANARVIYVMSGTDAAGIANANRLGEMIYEELTRLPAFISTPPLYPEPRTRTTTSRRRG